MVVAFILHRRLRTQEIMVDFIPSQATKLLVHLGKEITIIMERLPFGPFENEKHPLFHRLAHTHLLVKVFSIAGERLETKKTAKWLAVWLRCAFVVSLAVE